MADVQLKLVERARLPGQAQAYILDYEGFEFMVFYKKLTIAERNFFLIKELHTDLNGSLSPLTMDTIESTKLFELAKILGANDDEEESYTAILQAISFALATFGDTDDEDGAGDPEPRGPLPSSPGTTIQLTLDSPHRVPDEHPAAGPMTGSDAGQNLGGNQPESPVGGGAADDDIPF